MGNICDIGYCNLIIGYLKQIAADYQFAVERNNINAMIEIEEDVLSDDFFGDICGITSGVMLRKLRYEGYDTDKYIVCRNPNTGFPVSITKKERSNGTNRRRKVD